MKINKNTSSFIKSTLIVLFISSVIGLTSKLAGNSFLVAFTLSVCLQYILFTFLAYVINSYFAQKTKLKELDKLEQLSSILLCAFCQKPNVITFIPDQNERIEFLCDHCSGKNVVTMNFTVARVTDPIISSEPSLPTPPAIIEGY
jgi:hypothetical protein